MTARQKRITFLRPLLLPWIVLLAGLATTTVFSLVLSRTVRARDEALFRSSVVQTISNIETRIETYVAMLRAGAAYVAANPNLTEAEFRSFFERLKLGQKYPGIQGYGLTVKLAPSEVDAFELRQQDRFPGFRVWPEDEREAYHTIVYLEPLDDRNRAAIGYDMFTDPVRREAMQRAAASGEPAASGRVILVQEIHEDVQPGFLIYVPVYHRSRAGSDRDEADLFGYVYAPFRAEDLLHGIFSGEMPRVSFEIHDGETSSDTLLYKAHQRSTFKPQMTATRQITVAGREWTIHLESTAAMEGVSDRRLVPAAFSIGTITSMLLAGLVLMQRRIQRERERLLDAEREARSEAERIGRMKDEFLATLSHELRTPMTAIVGWADLLKNGGLGEEDVRNGLDVIERNAQAQSKLIADLLDMNRIVSGKLRIELAPTDLAKVVRTTVEALEPMARNRNVKVETRIAPDLPPIKGDAHRLQQIIWNLLSNAIKFSNKGGTAEISVQWSGDQVEVIVRDEGEGIGQEFLEHVFDRFRQADSSTVRKSGGLGLGLTITKSLVEIHEGTIEAHSDGPGKGATFRVLLPTLHEPLAVETTLPEVEDTGVNGALKGRNILIVEDEADSREMIQRILIEAGARVRAAASATEGMDLIREETPDLIVSDIGMPGMDGYGFMREVRRLPARLGGAAPAIALTAFARPQDKQRAIEAGFQAHMGKPVKPLNLLRLCVQILKGPMKPNG